MANIQDTVGLTFLDKQAFQRAMMPYAHTWEHLDAGELNLFRLVLDGAIQLYSFRWDDHSATEVHYATSTRNRLRYSGYKKDEFAANPFTLTKLSFTVVGRPQPACMVVHMPEAVLHDMQEGLYLMQVAVYAQCFHIFRSEAEFKKHHMPIGRECFYPVPSKHAAPDGSAVLTDRTVISGIVEAYEMRINSLSGVPYFPVRVRCLGLLLDVLIAGDELLPDQIRVGYILSAIAYHVSARPIRRLDDEA